MQIRIPHAESTCCADWSLTVLGKHKHIFVSMLPVHANGK